MLHYLKIFSWFLFTFGVVGIGAVALGYDPGFGPKTHTFGLLALQVLVSSLVLAGFRLHAAGRINRKGLLYGGWCLIVLFIVLGQVWINLR